MQDLEDELQNLSRQNVAKNKKEELVTDFRTFYNDYLMVVKFFEWLKEKAEG